MTRTATIFVQLSVIEEQIESPLAIAPFDVVASFTTRERVCARPNCDLQKHILYFA